MNIEKFDDFFDEHLTLAKIEKQTFGVIASDETEIRCNLHITNKRHGMFIIKTIVQALNLKPQEVMYEIYKEITDN